MYRSVSEGIRCNRCLPAAAGSVPACRPLVVPVPTVAPHHQEHKRGLWHQLQSATLVCRAEQNEGSAGEGKQSKGDGFPDSLPIAGADTDWREFRARLILNSGANKNTELEPGTSGRPSVDNGYWAHTIPGPEQGCLLIAHPLMFIQSQTYFSQAVIFMFGHDDHGSCGLILNRPTQHNIGKLAGANRLCPEFSQNELYLGGDVGVDAVHMLHGHAQLPGSQKVVNGIHIGGFEAARTMVREGNMDPHSIRWFTRYSGWGPGQLQAEVAQGVWFCAAAGPALVLQPHSGLAGQAGLWHATLDLMGGEFAELSASLKPENQYRPDVMGHGKFHPTAEENRRRIEEQQQQKQQQEGGGDEDRQS